MPGCSLASLVDNFGYLARRVVLPIPLAPSIAYRSREQLERVIQAWAEAFSLEQFFRGVEDQVAGLPDQERQEVLRRLELARDFVGTQNPLDFFLGWKTPIERYVPLAQRQQVSDAEDGNNHGLG